MNKFLKLALAINLIILAVLSFVYPHLMVGPGKLIPAHKELSADCFACHIPLMGVKSDRCINCHKPNEIGLFTTKGLTIKNPSTSTPFHQQLISQNCVDCHSDHAGVKRYKKHGDFNHALLKSDTRKQCQNCHQNPEDSIHNKLNGNCTQCHSQDKWLPATFDHRKYFMLDDNHNTRCVTCHVGNNYRRYTCFGCHEHSRANVRREHIEEGIRNFDNCVKCHRSGNGDESRGSEGNTEEDD